MGGGTNNTIEIGRAGNAARVVVCFLSRSWEEVKFAVLVQSSGYLFAKREDGGFSLFSLFSNLGRDI